MRMLMVVLAVALAVGCCKKTRVYPQETRLVIYQGCLRHSTPIQCGCMVRRIEKLYTHEEILAIEKRVIDGEDPPPKLAAVGPYCRRRF